MDISKQFITTRLLAACLLWLCGAWTVADAARQQYETEVVVKSQSPAVRDAAMATALRQVLSRVAGEQGALQTEPVQALLQKPSRVVQQYRYFTVPNSQPPVLKLWVRFDSGTIEQALGRQGREYEEVTRPDTLVWLAVDEGGRHYLVSSDDETDVRRQSTVAARSRGVPILFPLMDLQDQSSVRFSELWNGSFDQVLRASNRYNPQAVLIGRLQRSLAGDWSALWYMDNDGRSTTWSDSGGQLYALLQRGMDDVSGYLSTGFAGASGTGGLGGMNISVSGIHSLDAYARANEYLESLSPVRDIQVVEVNGPEVQYRLYLNGSQQELMRVLSIGTVLEPLAGQAPGSFRLRQ